MASPESLLKDLATETLTGEITALKAKVDELSVQLTQAQREKEELQAAQSQSKQKTDELERHKSAVELKLNDLTNSKQESMAIINDLRQTLAVERSDKAKLAQEAKDNYIKWIKSQGDKEGEHYQNEALKLQLQTVQAQLSTMEQQHANIRHALLAAETEVQLANDTKRRERAQARSDKTTFEKQEALLSSSVEQLRLELRQCQLDKDSAEDRARHAEERSSKLEISLAATNKSHADVVKVFERQRNDADDQIARFSAELEAAQEQAGLKNKQLIEENAELKKQLQEVNDRLAVMRSCVDQQLGKSPGNEQTAPASPGNNQSAQPLLGGRLLEEMKKYESTGRYWDDIFSDFFKLKEANDRLTKMNKELTAVNRDYMREKDNSYGYYTRLEAEVERLRINQTAHTNAVQELAKLKASQQEQHLAQKKQLDDLARDKQDVEASLNDTSYQLRYLLRYVQFQYGALPPKLQETGDLLDDAQIPPTLDHDDIVFKDFDEMQQRNQQFMSDVRRLKADVLQKSQEIDQLQADLSDKQAQLDNAFGQSTSVIRDQREKLEALEYRLSLTVAERDRLQQLVGTSSMDMTSHVAVQPDVADKLAQSEQKVQDLTGEMDAYHQEVELEMAEIRGELKQIHGDARQLRDDLSKAQAERDQLQARNRDLLHIADQRLAEVHAMRQRETVQDGRIDDLETRLTAANAEASDLTRQLETLRATSMTTEAQLKGYEQSYERLCLENKELAHERANLTTLLQSMNENLGNATGSTAHVVQELRAHNERLTRELDHLRDRLNAKENEVRALQAVDQHEWRDKYQAATGEVKQLTTNCLEIEKQLAAATQDRILAQTKLSEVSRELQKLQQQQTGSGDAKAPAETAITSEIEIASADNGEMATVLKQLNESKEKVSRLTHELFEYKDRLEQADATTNKVTSDFAKFTSDSQIRIDQLADNLSASHDKVTALQQELEQLTVDKRDAQAALGKAEQAWHQEKNQLVQEKADLADKVKTAADQITQLQADLDRHVRMLKDSDDRYQSEVAAHNQAQDTLTKLRDDIQRLTMDVSSSKSEALSYQERLRNQEIAQRAEREQLEKTNDDMKLRLDESQKQQEELSAKIQELLAKVNELRQLPGVADDAALTVLTDSATQQLRNVAGSLRTEKDLWLARHADAQQRANRAEADLEFVQRQLATTRAMLEALRAEKDDASRSHVQSFKDLQNEVALFKENNTMLRTTLDASKARVAELETLLNTKNASVEPLELKVQSLQRELALQQTMIEQYEKKQAQWTARSAMLLSKHNITDPQELEKLRAELADATAKVQESNVAAEKLKVEQKDLEAKFNALKEEHDKMVPEFEQKKQEHDKLQASSTKHLRIAIQLKNRLGALETEHKEAKAKLEEKEKQLVQLQQQAKENAVNNNKQPQAQPQQGKTPVATASTATDTSELETKLKTAQETQTTIMTKLRQVMFANKQSLAQADKFKKEKEELEKQVAALEKQIAALKEELEKTKQELAASMDKAKSLDVQLSRSKALESVATSRSEKMKKEVESLKIKLQQAGVTPDAANAPSPMVVTPAADAAASPSPSTPSAAAAAASSPSANTTTTSNNAAAPAALTTPAATASPQGPSNATTTNKLSPTATPFTPANGTVAAGMKRSSDQLLEEQPSKK